MALESGTLADGQPAVLLRVRDSGIGMSADVVAKLFAPFTQADASIARQFGGTGLGLSISHRLVALMRGQITVQSSTGVGSEFAVVLPLHEAQLEVFSDPGMDWHMKLPASAPSAEQAAASGQLILLAEDHAINCDVLVEQLRLLGHCAEIAEDGCIALEKWRSGRFALLLTDCYMPHLDGFSLTGAIRAAEAPGQRLPIIAVTANAMHGEAQRCLEAGMDDYLSKPLPNQSAVVREVAMNAPESVASQAFAARAAGTFDIWSLNTLNQLVGENHGMRQRLLEKFLFNGRQQVSSIEAAA